MAHASHPYHRIALVLLAVVAFSTGCKVPLGGTAAPARSSGPVPNVTGHRLSVAESELTDAGFTKFTAKDATGQNRVVIEPVNWIVVSQSPKAGTTSPTSVEVTLSVRKPTDGRGPVDTTIGTVPDVVCMGLQDAQETLRSAGFFNLRSTDGSGKARYIILDRDWVVTGQSARAGSKPGLTTRIVLTAVKYGEPTGASGCAS